jgi:hypothetical protein
MRRIPIYNPVLTPWYPKSCSPLISTSRAALVGSLTHIDDVGACECTYCRCEGAGEGAGAGTADFWALEFESDKVVDDEELECESLVVLRSR